MSPEEPGSKEDNSGQMDLYLEKGPDDNTLERMRQVAGSSEQTPFEADLSAVELGALAHSAEEIERVLARGRHRAKEELKKRGASKLATVEGCKVYGRTQILSGSGVQNFHRGANKKEAFYIGMDVRPDGASAYSGDYERQVQRFGRHIERNYPGYLVSWDGRVDHPVNLWVPISKL